jgi:hypothetical protein
MPNRPSIIGATHHELTRFRAARVGGGVYGVFERTRDFGTEPPGQWCGDALA